MKNKDVRLMDTVFEVRSLENDKQVIRGYALKFDKASEDLGFTEFIDRRALDDADMSNVVALLNHDSNYVLGRTGRNLKLDVDETGLYFEIKPNDTTYTRDLIENMRTGLIDKCSFAFSIADGGDEWRKTDNDKYERTINKIERLYDVSVVTTPAYSDTEVMLSQRSLDRYKQQLDSEKITRSREVEIMEMELDLV